jgi:hypothetical protein
LPLLGLLVVAATLPMPDARADQAGVATAVNTTARGLPQGGDEHDLDVGAGVEQRERIATDSAGQAQLLMLDGSSFTIGPGASVVLDEFYYDPAQGTGRASISLAKGLLRFVGGKLSKTQAVTIDTPNGTVGIRGGIAIIDVDERAGTTHATFLYGVAMTVTGKLGGVETVRAPGYVVTVERNGRPSKPERVTKVQLVRVSKVLSGHVERPIPSEIKLVKREAAPLPVKPVTKVTKPTVKRPPPRPIRPIQSPHLPTQARPKAAAKPSTPARPH